MESQTTIVQDFLVSKENNFDPEIDKLNMSNENISNFVVDVSYSEDLNEKYDVKVKDEFANEVNYVLLYFIYNLINFFN